MPQSAGVRPRLRIAPPPELQPVRTLVTLGDSTAAGLGDPLPGGGWRGFPVLLADALARRFPDAPGTLAVYPAFRSIA